MALCENWSYVNYSPYYSKLGNLEGEFRKKIDTNIVPIITSSVISWW